MIYGGRQRHVRLPEAGTGAGAGPLRRRQRIVVVVGRVRLVVDGMGFDGCLAGDDFVAAIVRDSLGRGRIFIGRHRRCEVRLVVVAIVVGAGRVEIVASGRVAEVLLVGQLVGRVRVERWRWFGGRRRRRLFNLSRICRLYLVDVEVLSFDRVLDFLLVGEFLLLDHVIVSIHVIDIFVLILGRRISCMNSSGSATHDGLLNAVRQMLRNYTTSVYSIFTLLGAIISMEFKKNVTMISGVFE